MKKFIKQFSLILLIILASSTEFLDKQASKNSRVEIIPKTYASTTTQNNLVAANNTKQVCKTVYDTITSASGNRSLKPRQVCQTVMVPMPTNTSTTKTSTPQIKQPTPTNTPATKTSTPQIKQLTPTNTSNTQTTPQTTKKTLSKKAPYIKVFTESTPQKEISKAKQDTLDQEKRSVLIRALWEIRYLLFKVK